jgi:hypothetical protein
MVTLKILLDNFVDIKYTVTCVADAQSWSNLLYSASRICDLRFGVGFGSLPVIYNNNVLYCSLIINMVLDRRKLCGK